MPMNIHPLQEASVSLLRELHSELNKPLTRAMITISNGYYPSLESILSTLDHYKEENVVIDFVQENSGIIESAKSEVQNAKAKAQEQKTDKEPAFEDIFSTRSFKYKNAYTSMKSVSLASVEEALSRELSNLCNEELVVEIGSIQEGHDGLRKSAELSVRVKPKH